MTAAVLQDMIAPQAILSVGDKRQMPKKWVALRQWFSNCGTGPIYVAWSHCSEALDGRREKM